MLSNTLGIAGKCHRVIEYIQFWDNSSLTYDIQWSHLPAARNNLSRLGISGLLLLAEQTNDDQDNYGDHGNAGNDDADYRSSRKLFLVTIVITTTVITVGRTAGSDKSFLALWAVIVVIISYISAFYIHNLTIYRVLLTKCWVVLFALYLTIFITSYWKRGNSALSHMTTIFLQGSNVVVFCV